MRRSIFISAIALIATTARAQEKAPLLTGKVNISIQDGTFECDLTLSDIPPVKNYFIRLNSGMNPLHFRSRQPNDFLIGYDKSFTDTTSTGESNAYFFPDNTRKGKFLPAAVQIKYVGKFPVVKDTLTNYSAKDWKGNIAFNHNSVRADGVQSAWYPVLYDAGNDKSYENVRYDLDITCKDCSTLYINGSVPEKKSTAHFKSDVPQELVLFCGNYKYSNIGNTYVLNPDITATQIAELSTLTNSYKKFYTEKLGIPFEQAVTFIQTTPTSARDGWMFVTYPSIVSIGWGNNGLKSLFDPKMQHWYRPYIAHELGHYYFGNYKVFNAELGDMMSEGFAEYLSLKLTKEIIGKEVYDQKMKSKLLELEEFKAVPFSNIRSKADYDDREVYVYYYAPVVFLAIEKEIGEKLMWKWLNTILSTNTTFTNYAFLSTTLQRTINNEATFDKIRKQYLESEKSLENAISKLAE